MRKKNKKNRNKRLPKDLLYKEITGLFKRTPSKRYNAPQIISRLKLDYNRDSVYAVLLNLERDGVLRSIGKGKFQWNFKAKKGVKQKKLRGIIELTRRGSGFVLQPGGDDIFVPIRYTKGAFSGDEVEVELRKSRGSRREGRVLQILKRKTNRIPGNIVKDGNTFIFEPDDQRFPFEIEVEIYEELLPQMPAKVEVEITSWPSSVHETMHGRIVRNLGDAGEHQAEMQAILLKHGFKLDFPKKVLTESKQVGTTITKKEIEGRRDFRDTMTFTIDPTDAKDFDDAISIKKMSNGNYEIGVHIADVSHYVQENSALDKEARKRGNSVYLVNHVLPMLPERLSNGICSLRPNEDRLAFSVVFIFGKNLQIVDSWIGRTIIHSDKRFTYEDAQFHLQTQKGKLGKSLVLLDEIARKFRKARLKSGAIAFESSEMVFNLANNGTVRSIKRKERLDTHMLVEDFMLLANREVARYIGKENAALNIPFMYRVHDLPDEDRLYDLIRFAKEEGLEIELGKSLAKTFNNLIKAARASNDLQIIERMAIRSMAKAEYHTQNIGHYGLAFDYYGHFTSPIRRYADLMVHRIVWDQLTKPKRRNKKDMQEICVHVSTTERQAMKAERESKNLKMAEYMSSKIGRTYPARVNGFNEHGAFVEIPALNGEGFIPFSSMEEYMMVDSLKFSATSIKSGKMLRIGHSVKVSIMDVDLPERKVFLELV